MPDQRGARACGTPDFTEVRILSVLLVAMLLVCAVSACHTMKPVQPSQPSSQTINRVWITKGNDSAIVLVHPQLRGDTLAGFVNGAWSCVTGVLRDHPKSPHRQATMNVVMKTPLPTTVERG